MSKTLDSRVSKLTERKSPNCLDVPFTRLEYLDFLDYYFAARRWKFFFLLGHFFLEPHCEHKPGFCDLRQHRSRLVSDSDWVFCSTAPTLRGPVPWALRMLIPLLIAAFSS
jgi:hypothetical protein